MRTYRLLRNYECKNSVRSTQIPINRYRRVFLRVQIQALCARKSALAINATGEPSVNFVKNFSADLQTSQPKQHLRKKKIPL